MYQERLKYRFMLLVKKTIWSCNINAQVIRNCFTLMTTEVTPLSTQKYVPERRAYCSENFLIISTDLSVGSAEKKKKIKEEKKFAIMFIEQNTFTSLEKRTKKVR